MACGLTVWIALLVPADAPKPADWPQWRGPNRDGVAPGTAWPDDLKTLKQTWRVADLGPSYSGPLVVGDRVFTTETVDKKEERITAYNRADGKLLWQVSWPGATTVPFFAAKNGSWIRATPAYFDGKLYVLGIRDKVVCLDAKTGKLVWEYDFPKENQTPVPSFGAVCSPLVDESGVYTQAGLSVVRLDRLTGKLLWRSLKEKDAMLGSAFSSPVVATIAGREQLIVQTRAALAGLDKATGDTLWEKPIPSFRGMNILTPLPTKDGVFTSTYGGNTRLVKVDSDGKGLSATDGWSLKYEGHMTTPVAAGGHAYYLGKDRRMICVELATGKEAWRTDKRFTDYGSMALRGDKILFLDSSGKLYLIAADPKEYRELAETKVAEAESWAHLAVSGDEVFVRDLTGLTAFRFGKE